MTFDEIRKYRVKDSTAKLTDQQIPSIDEVFELFHEVRSQGNHCRLLVEIKRTNNIYQGFYMWLTKSFLNDIHNHGKQVKIWTLEGTEVSHLDVNGIITNRPDLWRGLRNTTFN